jgi:DNA replication ATP-dependent helicase Dna2
MCQKYALVRGVPGSGKTRLVVALVRILATRMGLSVLLVSYTHSAVDNVLAKLLSEHGDEFHAGNTIRLGSSARMHSDVLSVADENVVRDAKSVADLERIYASKVS